MAPHHVDELHVNGYGTTDLVVVNNVVVAAAAAASCFERSRTSNSLAP